MDDRPTEKHTVLASGVEDGITWCVCPAPLPAANGYVKLPDGHPWAALNYDDIPVDAPGGITWAQDGWIGFDTLHLGDTWSQSELERMEQIIGQQWPSSSRRYQDAIRTLEREGTSWTLELVIEETKRLAQQVVMQ